MQRLPLSLAMGAGLWAALLMSVEGTEALRARVRQGELFVSAPDLKVLEGQVLDRLKNGSAVPLDYHLSLFSGGGAMARKRAFERFVFSYDLWEEKYSVSTVRKPRSAAARLNAREAEAWALEHLAVPVGDAPVDQEVRVRLEIRVPQGKPERDWLDEEGINLGSLIEALSRPQPKKLQSWLRESGPVRLKELSAPVSLKP